MQRYACRLAYDGTAYHGFQRQVDDQPTVQKAVEDALSNLMKQPCIIRGAGRTDSGVHASGQVIAFDLNWQHSPQQLLKAVNANLPPDVALHGIRLATDDFHPRYDARSRMYLYRILRAPARDPLRRNQAWYWPRTLDVPAMQTCASLLIGTQDFATFGTPPQGNNTVRTIWDVRFEPVRDELYFFITANAFLKRMVRSIVGTLVDVGRGKMSGEAFQLALDAGERSKSGRSAPPQGLTLTRVIYESEIDRLFDTGDVNEP